MTQTKNVKKARLTKSARSPEEKLAEEIELLGHTHGVSKVFDTFLELTATGLSAQLDPVNYQERAERFEELTAKMDEKTIGAYFRMMEHLRKAIDLHRKNPVDIMGKVYMHLNLHNKWNGQFFTPDNICRLMAELSGIGEKASQITEQGSYMRINEPTCGSGAMLIGAVNALQKHEVDYRRKTLFVAQDCDKRCVWMTYIQCCMYHIPAIVVQGDSLTMQMNEYWYTLDGMKLLSKSDCINEEAEEAEKTLNHPTTQVLQAIS